MKTVLCDEELDAKLCLDGSELTRGLQFMSMHLTTTASLTV